MQRILQPGEIEALDRTRLPRLRMPQPASLFADRAARLRQLAEGNPIADYLRFAARLVQAQQRLAAGLPAAEAPAEDNVERANATGMPLLPASEPLPPVWHDLLRALVAEMAGDASVPPPLRPVLDRLATLDHAALDRLARAALGECVAAEDLAAAPLAMAALQVVFTQRAAAVPAASVPYCDPATICPVCGSLPVASVLRIGGEAAGHRYLHCSLCATEWHMVRVKCSHCESTEGVRYQGVEGAGTTVQAETCDPCHTYRKIVDQEKDPLAEPLADDLASLTLDLLMGETAYAHASGNPLLMLAPQDG